MCFSDADHEYYRRENARAKEEVKTRHMPNIQNECSKQLTKIKQILVREDVSIDDFIKEYTEYTKFFIIKEKISFDDIKNIIVSGTLWNDISKFLMSDFVKDKKQKLDNERKIKEREEIIQKQKRKEEERIKKEEENLRKEYECIKLYNIIESKQMESYELYKEYTIIKLLREQHTNKFIKYFTTIKIDELHKLIDI